MNILEFIRKSKNKSFWASSSVASSSDASSRVICFRSKEFVPLFFKYLFSFLNNKNIVNIESSIVNDRNILLKNLHQSFLGETSFYWLGDVSKLFPRSKKKEPELIDLLSLYRGPHSILFFIGSEQKISVSIKKRITIIDLNIKNNFNDVLKIFSFFGLVINNKSNSKKLLIKDIFTDQFSLDDIYMISNYLSVIREGSLKDLKKNLSVIMSSKVSLFDLSESFFEKEESRFFNLWGEVCSNYPVPFWINYWSDQLWRAFFVVKYLKEKKVNEAKSFSFRLSYSFVRSSWRKCSLSEIKRAHQNLYDIDFAYKRGSKFCLFDVFYSNYFKSKIG